VTVCALDDVGDRSVVVELEALGLCERALEAVGADRGREVEESAGDGGDGDAFVGGGVTGIEGACAVQADARNAASRSGRRDVRARLLRAQEPPVRGGAAMAERRTRPAREDRRGRRPSTRSAVCPSAYTPRCTTCNRLARTQ
jgi:hypothetical protein